MTNERMMAMTRCDFEHTEGQCKRSGKKYLPSHRFIGGYVKLTPRSPDVASSPRSYSEVKYETF